ncbi:acetate--CoA ligase family protein [Infirmifilum sp. NZ]|uniref:acetate--CoA ligase family protein n=1 Tax=Infirmifilum sp. NZ TaxID=2926850 RepID=UPI0027A3B034|nr:acetate--CoA ligase family protein [Infirmifilum sp. NZ]UNQ73500.1 acetate--CoA ligase family protein [Infirmifilum sp. NZ]
MECTPSFLIDSARSEGRSKLLEHESFCLCEHYGIPVPRYGVARSSEEAVRIAKKIGFPVVLKVISPDVVHKSDVGGVILDVRSPEEVREKYSALMRNVTLRAPGARVYGVLVQEMVPRGLEVIVGATRDPYFGPVVMFGLGGVFVEVLKDVSFRVAPLTPIDAGEMVREVKGYRLFEAFRGEAPRDRKAVEEIILRVSELIEDLDEVSEVDLNPVIVFEEGLGAKVADARFMLR